MTDWEIFRAAVVKANENLPEDSKILYTPAHQLDYRLTKGKGTPKTMLSYYIIFSHLFAKAFFGEQKGISMDVSAIPKGFNVKEFLQEYQKQGIPFLDLHSGVEYQEIGTEPSWKVHLRNMVLEEKPLQYLKKFL